MGMQMTTLADLTRSQRLGLEWFAKQRAPVGMFALDDGTPSRVIRKRLFEKGLIAPAGSDRGFQALAITDAGRAALAR